MLVKHGKIFFNFTLVRQHSRFLTQGRDKEPEVLFLGDSTLFNFEATKVCHLLISYLKIYKTYVEPLHCLNFSIPNDETQNILWRVLNGELDDVKVKVIDRFYNLYTSSGCRIICWNA